MQSQASGRREAFGSGQQSFSSSDWLRGSTSRYINFPGEIFFWLRLLNMEPLGICRFWDFMFYTWSHFFIPVVLFWQSAVFITLTWENCPLCSILSVLGRFVKRWAGAFQLLLTLWKSDMAAHRAPAPFDPEVTTWDDSITDQEVGSFDCLVLASTPPPLRELSYFWHP